MAKETMRDTVGDDKFHDECGVFGIYNHPEAARLTYLGLYAQQHRGQESAGIVSSSGRKIHHHKGMGQVAEASIGLTTLRVWIRETSGQPNRRQSPARRRSGSRSCPGGARR